MTMEKMIYLDIDGSINNFYGVEGWLDYILNGDETPYRIAPCTVNEEAILRLVNYGYKIGIISWLAKNSTKEYDTKVRRAKKEWLKENYPNVVFEEIHIVKYGTPKYKVAKIKNSILFDDELPNRMAWKGLALEPKEIFTFC